MKIKFLQTFSNLGQYLRDIIQPIVKVIQTRPGFTVSYERLEKLKLNLQPLIYKESSSTSMQWRLPIHKYSSTHYKEGQMVKGKRNIQQHYPFN